MSAAGALAMLALLVAPQPGADRARAEALRRELADVAARIEQMKSAGVRGGPEIQALLVRSQALATELDGLDRHARPAEPAVEGADPQELRERADALRDEVDRLQGALADVDRRLRTEGRRRRAGRLATMEEEGALFSEASPGRLGAPQPDPGATGAGAPTPAGPPGPVAPGSSGGSPAPQPGPMDAQPGAGAPTAPAPEIPPDVAPDPSVEPPPTAGAGRGGAAGSYVWSSPGDSRRFSERLAPGRSDGEAELRHKRSQIVEAIGEAEAAIKRIEAEARELDARP